jgi:hypothetical protein
MAIFAIIKQPSQDPPGLGNAVALTYPNAHYVLNDSTWLVAAQSTAVDVSIALGLGPQGTNTGAVFEVGSYYGRANPAIWTWIKTNWEASSG